MTFKKEMVYSCSGIKTKELAAKKYQEEFLFFVNNLGYNYHEISGRIFIKPGNKLWTIEIEAKRE
jgi:hypothetical protein